MKDLGKPAPSVGIELEGFEGTVHPDPRNLIKKCLNETGMETSKPVKRSVAGTVYDEDDDGSLLKEVMKVNYRSIVRNLLYLSLKTRPDLWVAATMLGAHVDQPNEKDYIVVKRVLR